MIINILSTKYCTYYILTSNLIIILIILFGGVLLTIGLIWAQMWLYRKTVKQVIAANVSYDTLFGDVPTEVGLPTSENDRAPTSLPHAETGDTGGESTT